MINTKKIRAGPDKYKKNTSWSIDFLCIGVLRRTATCICITVNPVLSGHSKMDKTKILMTNGDLMMVESIAECSLRYF